MGAKDFLYKEFAEDLSSQALPVLPQDLSQSDKDYVYNTIKNYCMIAGEALCNDQEHDYTVEQASVITQFIGEWSYHKSMDLIRGNIPSQFRDSVMQKIAFTIFEIAKQATFKNVPTDQMIGIVEHHVKKAYNEALAELMKRGVINQQQAQFAANQSNIDVMAQQDEAALNNASDLKVLKLAAFALIAKKLPNDKVTTILTKFNASDANIVMQYMQMDNLEQQIDPTLLAQCLKQFQNELPQTDFVNVPKIMRAFGRNVKSVSAESMQNIISNERSLIIKLVENPVHYERYKFSPQILNLICKHIESKVHDYQKASV